MTEKNRLPDGTLAIDHNLGYMVNKEGMKNVLFSLQLVCLSKAKHAEDQDKDHARAGAWDTIAQELKDVMESTKLLGLST